MDRIALRLLAEADLAAADDLRRLAGWNQTLQDWHSLLSLEPEGCFVAVENENVVGSVTTTTYGKTLAWIGMMLVHPDQRRRGIGTRLMQRALEYLRGRGIECIKLDATPAGRPLYERLGFLAEWTLTRSQRAGSEAALPQCALAPARSLTDTDWKTVDKLDAAAIGAPRPYLIRSLVAQSRAALVWPAQGDVAGWGLLRSGANADYLGPLACFRAEGLLPLVTALLRTAGSRSVIWDVPERNEEGQSVARQLGFAPLRPLTRMRLGENSAAVAPPGYFAIADPSVG
jgi:ribosomal protein S18 acetylase RimI-like enzyme